MYGSLLQSIRGALRGSKARAAVWLLLAAVTLQFAVTRAHFHFQNTAQANIASASVDGAGGGSSPAQTPVHDQSNCPLWHAGNICGAALTAVAAVLFAPPERSDRAAHTPAAPAGKRISANWQSRAPPTL